VWSRLAPAPSVFAPHNATSCFELLRSAPNTSFDCGNTASEAELLESLVGRAAAQDKKSSVLAVWVLFPQLCVCILESWSIFTHIMKAKRAKGGLLKKKPGKVRNRPPKHAAAAAAAVAGESDLTTAQQRIAAGLTAAARGDCAASLQCYKAAVAACPRAVEPHCVLAKALRAEATSREDLDEVERELKAALSNVTPRCTERESDSGLQALQMLGLHLCQEGREEEARGALRALGKLYR
jgi:tetratricopeptide (TPR) repeat protein